MKVGCRRECFFAEFCTPRNSQLQTSNFKLQTLTSNFQPPMAQLHPQTLKYLGSLKKNNNKPWFDKNKPQYEEIKNELVNVAADMIKEVSKFDSAVAATDPKKSVFRIYRDIRFSADKTPYKTNMGFWMSKGGIKLPSAGYYVHLQ